MRKQSWRRYRKIHTCEDESMANSGNLLREHLAPAYQQALYKDHAIMRQQNSVLLEGQNSILYPKKKPPIAASFQN